MKNTPNFNLPLYEPNDLANLTDGYNNAMSLIDTDMKTVTDHVDTYDTRITANADAIAAETTRATAAEKVNADAIASVNVNVIDEVARSTNTDAYIKKVIKVSSNPIDYGADPTGAIDSTKAIADCIEANKGGHIIFTQGTYLIETSISTPYPTADRISIDFNYSTLKFNSASQTKYAFFIGGSEYNSDVRSQEQNDNCASEFKNVTIITNGNYDYAIAVASWYQNAHIFNVKINCGKNGILLGHDSGNVKPSDARIFNFFMYNYNNVKNSYAINAVNSDNQYAQGRIYNFQTAIKVAPGDRVNDVHCLTSTSEMFENSVSILAENATFMASNLYCDTNQVAIRCTGHAKFNATNIYMYSWMDDVKNRKLLDCESATGYDFNLSNALIDITETSEFTTAVIPPLGQIWKANVNNISIAGNVDYISKYDISKRLDESLRNYGVVSNKWNMMLYYALPAYKNLTLLISNANCTALMTISPNISNNVLKDFLVKRIKVISGTVNFTVGFTADLIQNNTAYGSIFIKPTSSDNFYVQRMISDNIYPDVFTPTYRTIDIKTTDTEPTYICTEA